MNETYDKKMAVRAKAAFLGLFVLALAAARLVVAMRFAVSLSDPIELAYSGLSVSMPEGNGWRSSKSWDYSRGEITLLGTFAPGVLKATALVKCSYIFPAEIVDVEKRFERRRLAVDGKIVEEGQIESKSAVVDWVRMNQADGYNYIFGSAELPDYRRIEIEVQESAGDVDLAERVFRAIASNLSVTDNPLLESGAEMIAKMKNAGLAEKIENHNRRNLFFIRDSRMQSDIIGLTTDVLIDTGRTKEMNIEAMGLYYTRGVSPHEEMTSFQSDNRFDRFRWKTELVAGPQGARERTRVEVVLGDSGILDVTKIGSSPGDSSVIGGSSEPNRYHTSGASAPDVLIEQLLARMIEDGLEETLVDMITPYGSIVPTHISQIRSESMPGLPASGVRDALRRDPWGLGAGAEDAAYMVKLTPLDGRGFFRYVYLDNQSRISSSCVRGRGTLLFDRTEPEEAAKKFPERADLILQDEKLRQYLMDEMI
jgi:hypothetical protein